MEKYFIRNRYINETVNVDHNSLTNRDATECHPASSISYDDGSGTLTDVQTQLEKQKIELKETGEAINVAGLVTLNDADGKIYTSFEYGTPVQASNITYSTGKTIDIDTDKALVFFSGNGGTLGVKLATISGNTVTYGDQLNITESGCSTFSNPVKIATNSVVICFTQSSSNYYPKVCVVTVSGTTISVGTLYTLKSSNLSTNSVKLAYYLPNKIIAIYNDPNDSNNNYYNLLTISGSTISVGTATALTALTNLPVFNLEYADKTEFVIVNYYDGTKSYNCFRIVRILGSTLYVGNEFKISSFEYGYYTRIKPIDEARFLVTMMDYATSNYLVSFVCKWSSWTTVDSVSSYCILNTSAPTINDHTLIKLETNKFLLVYGNRAQILNIDDAVIKVSVIKTGFASTYTCEKPSSCNLSSGKVFVVFDDDGASDEIYGVVIDVNNSTGLALTPQFNSNLITDRTDNASVVPYLSLT